MSPTHGQNEKPHLPTVAADPVLVEEIQIHLVQYQHILDFHGSIVHHSLVLLPGAAIVTLAVAEVRQSRLPST